MEAQLGPSDAARSTLSCCCAALFDRQQEGNEELVCLALGKGMLGYSSQMPYIVFFPFSLGEKKCCLGSAGLGKAAMSSWFGLGFEWKGHFCGSCLQRGPSLRKALSTAGLTLPWLSPGLVFLQNS